MMSKQHILSELRRTAKENGGAPVGWRKFQKETGVSVYDWQKYWALWADAQREAGFVANEKNVAYSDDLLIEKFVSLIRELSRFPTKGDLRVKVFSDASFPSEKTYRRFGTKSQFAARIVGYCKDRDGYEDVVQLCNALPAEAPKPIDNNAHGSGEIGFVYLIKSGRYNKIGKTNSAGRREYELAIQLPEKPKTIHVIKTDDPSGIEAYWHKRFESKWKNGEWFDLASTDVQAFKRRKFM